MRTDLAQRLQKVSKALYLLKKIALSELEFIDRTSKRSLMALKRALGKLEAELDRLDRLDQSLKEAVLVAVGQIIGRAGVVNQEAIERKKPNDVVKAVHRAVPALAGPVIKLMRAAFLAAKLQNVKWIDAAKKDPKYRDHFYQTQERFNEALQLMDEEIRKIRPPDPAAENPLEQQLDTALEQMKDEESKKGPEPAAAPIQKPPQQDPSAEEHLASQINAAHADMLDDVQEMSKALLKRVQTLFPDDTELLEAIEQNIIAAMPGSDAGYGKKVNEELNKKDDFYRNVLELQMGEGYDLGEFLNTRYKKLAYQAYRSLVMSMRALGVMQWAKARPDLVLKSKKALALVIKSQKILRKRKELVVDRLTRIQAEEDEEDREAPAGTFQDSFESAA